MPTLQFKGKNIIWNHHLSIPYHTLDEVQKLQFQPEKANGNMIIEGDNLLGLKALLPQYANKIKCIYIDPPYNTGSENWIYNDKVNSPLIKEWLGKVVSKDDLTRHDKWLCMITPRLKLLRNLLSDNGVIFISIDDNEQTNLKSIMDEIFGETNFLGNLPRRTKSGGGSAASDFAIQHDYVLAYAKYKEKLESLFIPHDPDYIKRYKEEDEKGRYYWDTFERSYTKTKPYKIEAPDGKILSGNWFRAEERYKKDLESNEIRFVKKKDGEWSVQFKQRLGEGRKLRSLIENEFKSGQKDLENLNLGGKMDFPKPVVLIKELIQAAVNFDPNSIILDSFAGSGTTMHAVMELNKEDSGSRKCILVQMPESTEKEPDKNICKDITRERIKRAVEKYGYDSGFKYLKVGIPLDAESMLNGELPTYRQFAGYVYYLCTGENIPDTKRIDEKRYFAGTWKNQAIYLVYKKDYEALTRLALNISIAEKIIKDSPGKKRIVYAPACFLEEDYLQSNNIEFVGIPYNLFERNK